MWRNRSFWLAVVTCAYVVLASCISVLADIPQKMNYQLRLTDLAGQPLPGFHSMTFAIYDAETDGNQLWTETKGETADEDGVISTILGGVYPIDITFAGPTWLEVVVDGETLSPRREIVSSAYAYHSVDADKLGGLESTSYALTAHDHDDRYYTEVELNTSDGDQPNLGSNRVSWDNLVNVPEGFADGSDDAGAGGGGDVTDVSGGDGLWAAQPEGPQPILHVGQGTGVVVGADDISFDESYGDSRYVTEGQVDAVTSGMVVNGQIVDADISSSAAIAPSKISGIAWTSSNDGPGSGLDADLLDGQHASGFLSTSNDYGRSGVSTTLYEGTTRLADKYLGINASVDNADKVDGYHAGNSSGQVAVSNGTRCSNLNADELDGYDYDDLPYVNLTSSQSIGGLKTFTYQTKFTYSSAPPVVVETGNSNGIVVKNNTGGSYPTVWAEDQSSSGTNAIYAKNRAGCMSAVYAWNTYPSSGPCPLAVWAVVSASTQYAIGTNGRVFASAFETVLKTRSGDQVMTVPAAVQPEIHLSGSGSLAAGAASVEFDESFSKSISTDGPVRVIVTPTAMCNGIVVVEKSTASFRVQEIADGMSHATFDWIAIGMRPATPDGRGIEERPMVPEAPREPLPPATD